MSEIVWDDSWPKPKRADFDSGIVDSWVEDSSEVGAPRRRNRYTRSLETFKFSVQVTKAQWLEIRNFYFVTLDRGVRSFRWTDPTTELEYEVRMSSPTRQHVASDRYDIGLAFREI